MARVAVRLLVALLLAAPVATAQEAPAPSPGGQWLVIRTFDASSDAPAETISIPLSVLKRAARILPSGIRQEFEAEGLSIDEVVRPAEQEDLRGPIAQIDDGRTGERMIVAIE